MAKNWTLKEAVKVITTGEDKAVLQELGKRYPITSLIIAKMGTNAGIAALFDGMPEHVTMLKMERSLKDGVVESDEDEDEGEEETTTGKAAATGKDLSEMTSKELFALCEKKGIKAKKYGVNKQYYLDLLSGDDEDEDEEVDDADDDEVGIDYSEMTAPELFKLCKERKIKAEPKKKASVYIALLEEADEAAESGDEDEEWPDEEPAKETKKETKGKAAAKATTGKAKATSKEEEDWDI